MNVSSLQNVLDLNAYATGSVKESSKTTDGTSVFQSLYDAAVNQIEETDRLTNLAEEGAIKFVLGQSDSTHDLKIAKDKANISLQYTVTLRKIVLEAYKEIMSLQF